MGAQQSTTAYLAGALCSALLLLLTGGASAEQRLFESEVAVSSQRTEVRVEAMKTALREVLIRVTGDRSVLPTEPAQKMLRDPGSLVQQYRYFTVPGSRPPVLKLWLRFDGDAIRNGLQQRGVAYWGSERPDMLVWLAIEDQGVRYLVSAQDDTPAHQHFERAARQRGIPVVFPLLDLEDHSRVQFTDLWGGFFDQLLDASQRYNPQGVLIGRLNRTRSGGWMGRWTMQVAGNTSSWSNSDTQLAGLLQQGVNHAADALALRFSATGAGGNASAMNISVGGINSLAGYARVNDYLSSLSSVAEFRVEQVVRSTLHYALYLNGAAPELSRTIASGSVLEPLPGGMAGEYRLRQ